MHAPQNSHFTFTAATDNVILSPMLTALSYAARGWDIFPILPGKKQSCYAAKYAANGAKWGKTRDLRLIKKYFTEHPNYNIGIATGIESGIFVMEADTIEGHNVDGIASIAALEAKHGQLPETRMAISPSGSLHRFYKHPGADFKVWCSSSVVAPGVDIKGDGGMVLAPPSYKPKKYEGEGALKAIARYKWLSDLPIADAPQWLLDIVTKPSRKTKSTKSDAVADKPDADDRDDDADHTTADYRADPDLIIAALGVIPNTEAISFDEWNALMMAAWRATDGNEEVFTAFDRWSQAHSRYNAKRTRAKWDALKTSPPTDVGAGKIFFFANEARPTWRDDHQAAIFAALAAASTQRNMGGNENPPSLDSVTATTVTTRTPKALPTIRVKGGHIASNIEQAEAALLASGLPIFQRAGVLVRPIATEMPAADDTKTEVVLLRPLRKESMIYLLNKYGAVFERFDARSKKWFRIDPPKEIVLGLLQKDQWSFPEIAGVITAPTMRPDGTILDQPGFDQATQLYYHRDRHLDIPAISAMPSRIEADAALVLLKALLDGFPFVSEIDRAVALAALMMQILRGSFYVAPMTLMKAHQMSSGKSHLVNVASTIAMGRTCPVITNVASADEMEKRLGALILQGAPVISLDNCEDDVGGMLLCTLTEQRINGIRILGKSEMPACEYRGTVFATGNNITFRADMTRRGLICNLDAEVERPELREFKFDPVMLVAQDRGKYIHAILTISRAWRAAGSVRACTPIASYQRWSDAVREPLVWLGMEDPVKSMDTARDEDPDTIAVRTLLSLWPPIFGGGQYSVAQIIKAAEETTVIPGFEVRYEHNNPELRELLMEQAGGFKSIDGKKLGRWLMKIHGKIHGGQRLVLARKDEEHGHRYRVEFVKPAASVF